MACGAPVIASRIPALEETAASAALFFEPTSATELAQKIFRLLQDEHARRELSIAGRSRAAEFSWERTARLTFGIYQQALKQFSERKGASAW